MPFLALLAGWFESTNTCVQERYRTIRYRVWGIVSAGMNIDEQTSLACTLEEMFNEVLNVFPHVRPLFGRRKSSPGYNFVYRRLLDLVGHGAYGIDFPPLKSRKKRADAARLWRSFCIWLNWPYVNTDGTLFGSTFAVGPEELDRRSRPFKHRKSVQHVQQPQQHLSDPCGGGLRRASDENSSQEIDWGEGLADLPDFLHSCDGSLPNSLRGSYDGDCSGLFESSF